MRTSAKVSVGFYVAGALMLTGLFILSRTFGPDLHFATKIQCNYSRVDGRRLAAVIAQSQDVTRATTLQTPA
jgi:hypothetical protein